MTPTIAQIQRVTALHHGLPPESMTSHSRLRSVAHARQIAMCLSRRLTNHSFTRIGAFFGGRDHSTILFGERVAGQRDAATVRRLTLELLIPTGLQV
jgi:chromosomal replication initiator protein